VKSYLHADLDSFRPGESSHCRSWAHVLLHMWKLCACVRTVAIGTVCYWEADMLSFKFMLPGDPKKLKLSLTRLPMASNENFHLDRLDVDLAWHQTSSLLQNFTPIVFLLIKPCLTSALRNNLFQDITSTHKQLHSVCPISIIWLLCFPVLLLLWMLPGSQSYRKGGVLKLFCGVGRKERRGTEA